MALTSELVQVKPADETVERFRVLAATRAAQRGVCASEGILTHLLKKSKSGEFLAPKDIAA